VFGEGAEQNTRGACAPRNCLRPFLGSRHGESATWIPDWIFWVQGSDVATSWRVIQGLSVGLVIPDLWQQEAIRALQQGKDVVVQAPTGSGKTYIFELFYPDLKQQAVFTVPTRALANDKLAEWRARTGAS